MVRDKVHQRILILLHISSQEQLARLHHKAFTFDQVQFHCFQTCHVEHLPFLNMRDDVEKSKGMIFVKMHKSLSFNG